MAGPVYCNGCGQRLEIPAGFARAKMRCPECGVFTELTKEVREQGQAAAEPEASKETKPPVPSRSQSQPPPRAPQSRPAPETAPQSRPAPETSPPPPPSPPLQSELDMLTGGGYGFQSDPTPPAPKPESPPTSKRQPDRPKAAAAQAPPEREILIHGTEEEDFNPYTVPGDAPTKRCPECEKKIGVRDKVCSHCGHSPARRMRSMRFSVAARLFW